MFWFAATCAIAIAAEALFTWRAGRPAYKLRETELSLAIAAGWLTLNLYLPSVATHVPHLLGFTPLSMPNGIVGLSLLVVLGDFLLYWSHRSSHVFRWQWAAHEAHHSVVRLNFLATFRQGWTDLPAGIWLFMLPLALFGFSAGQWTIYVVLNHAWSMFIHNEWTPELGPLEWVLVTPSNHRVHHSLAAGTRAKNFGNMLIVWDRMFGTYAAETTRITSFGVTGRDFTSVLDTVFGEWREMLKPWWRRALPSAGR